MGGATAGLEPASGGASGQACLRAPHPPCGSGFAPPGLAYPWAAPSGIPGRLPGNLSTWQGWGCLEASQSSKLPGNLSTCEIWSCLEAYQSSWLPGNLSTWQAWNCIAWNLHSPAGYLARMELYCLEASQSSWLPGNLSTWRAAELELAHVAGGLARHKAHKHTSKHGVVLPGISPVQLAGAQHLQTGRCRRSEIHPDHMPHLLLRVSKDCWTSAL